MQERTLEGIWRTWLLKLKTPLMEQPVFDSAKGLDHRSPIMRSILTMAKPRNCKKRNTKHNRKELGTCLRFSFFIAAEWIMWLWQSTNGKLWVLAADIGSVRGQQLMERLLTTSVRQKMLLQFGADWRMQVPSCQSAPQMDKQFPCPHVCRGSQNAVTMHQSQRAGQHKEPVAAWSVLLGERCQDEVKGWTWPWCCSSTQTLIFFTAQQQLSNGVFLSTLWCFPHGIGRCGE